MLNDLKKYQDYLRAEELGAFNLRTFLRRIRRPQIAIPAIFAVIIIALVSVWFFNRQAKIRWAREEILPEVERLVNENWRDFIQPYNLAKKAEKYIPNDPKLSELFSKNSLNINIETEPPGADVYMKEYASPDREWEYLGVSPLENIRMPIGILRWKIEKEGYETIMAASTTFGGGMLVRVLDKKGSIQSGMVRVPGVETPLGKLSGLRHKLVRSCCLCRIIRKKSADRISLGYRKR